ncbi:hypothetical protein [Streptomyces sp. NPDC015125]
MSNRQPVSLQIYDRDGIDVHLTEDVPEGARPNITVLDKKVGHA